MHHKTASATVPCFRKCWRNGFWAVGLELRGGLDMGRRGWKKWIEKKSGLQEEKWIDEKSEDNLYKFGWLKKTG